MKVRRQLSWERSKRWKSESSRITRANRTPDPRAMPPISAATIGGTSTGAICAMNDQIKPKEANTTSSLVCRSWFRGPG
jgi:hypothetical protein